MLDVRALGKERELNNQSKIGAICLLRNGTTLASASVDYSLRIFDLLPGTSPAPVKLSSPHYDKILCLAVQGDSVLSGSRDYSIKRWELNAATNAWEQKSLIKAAHGAYVTALSPLPDQLFVSGSKRGDLKVWDAISNSVRAEHAAHAGAVTALVFDPRNHRLFSASSDRTVKVWAYAPDAPDAPPSRIPRVGSTSTPAPASALAAGVLTRAAAAAAAAAAASTNPTVLGGSGLDGNESNSGVSGTSVRNLDS